MNRLRNLTPLVGFDTMPERLISPGLKGADYHARMTRFCHSTTDTEKINRFRAHTEINRRFVAGNQWFFKEDIDTHLMDNSEDMRNRLAAVFNFCSVAWNKYRGTASKMTFGATATSVTGRTQSRREAEWARLLTLQNIASTSPSMKAALKSENPLGDTQRETFGIFENTTRDRIIEAHEHFMRAVAAMNNMGEDTVQMADDMFVSGVNAFISRGYGSDFRQDRIDPDILVYDTNASLYDLSDEFFISAAPLMAATEIYKEWQPGRDVIQHIESVMRATGNTGLGGNGGLINVLRTYWKDIMFQEYGYIKGANGVPEMVQVNYLPPGAGKDEKPRYTDADLIAPPDTEENNRLFGDQKKTKLETEIVRFCEMIPFEYLLGDHGVDVSDSEGMLGDIVLDYGVYDLQPYDPYQIQRVQLPIQASCYAIQDGMIVAPCTDIIMPQRFYNRIMSVTEQQINNSGSKVLGFDMSMVDDSTTPEEATRIARRGGVIPMRSEGLPVQQAFAVADTTPAAGTINYFHVAKEVQNAVRLISATPEPVTGQTQGDGLVRTTQLLIEHAGVLDQPFYNAIDRGKLQRYRVISTAGKEFFLRHLDVLSDIVNEPDLLPFLLSRDYELERFSIQIVRGNSEQTEKVAANELMLQMFKMQLLGQSEVADLFDRATTTEVAAAMRRFSQDMAQAQKQQAEQQRKEMATAAIAQREQQLNDQAQQVYEDAVEATMKKDANETKLKSNYTREHARAMFAPEEHVEPGGPQR